MKISQKKIFLRMPYFYFSRNASTKGKMPYPTHEIIVGEDKGLVYDIPNENIQEALDKANPLKGDMFFPIEYKNYRHAMILYVHGYNFIVQPDFIESGRTAFGWGLTKEDLHKIKEIEKHS